LTAVNSGGKSEASTQIEISTQDTASGAPTGLTLLTKVIVPSASVSVYTTPQEQDHGKV